MLLLGRYWKRCPKRQYQSAQARCYIRWGVMRRLEQAYSSHQPGCVCIACIAYQSVLLAEEKQEGANNSELQYDGMAPLRNRPHD